MKKFVIFLLLILSSAITNAAEINFMINPEWASVLKKAKEEKKFIFFDGFAAWCGPCKQMDSLVYTDPAVAAYYNENFINVKYDLEKGEGIALAEKFKVTAYPSLFFINQDGTLVYKSIGYREPQQLLSLGKDALKGGEGYEEIKAKATTLSPAEFLKFSAAAKEAEDEDFDDIARVFLSKQPDVLANTDLIDLIMTSVTFLPDEKVLAYVINNNDKIEATGKYNKEQIRQRMIGLAMGYAIFANTNDDDGETDLGSVKAILDKYIPRDAFFAFSYYNIQHSLEKEDQDAAFKTLMDIFRAPQDQITFESICSTLISFSAGMDKDGQLEKIFAALDNYQLGPSDQSKGYFKDLVKAVVYLNLKNSEQFGVYCGKVIQNSNTPPELKTKFSEMLENLKQGQ